MDSMYELLMGVPLFKGVGHDHISDILEKAKFHFLKYDAGSQIISAHDPCTHITCVISGSVRYSLTNQDGRFRLDQSLLAPSVIAPEFLFGKAPFYPCSVTALEPTGLLQISKNDYMKILYSNEVFMYNYLNTLSMHAQKAVEGILAITSGSLEERIALWVVSLTQRNGADITVRCKTRDLCAMLGVQRSSLIAALNAMKQRGIVDYDNREVRVLSRDAMLEIIMADTE